MPRSSSLVPRLGLSCILAALATGTFACGGSSSAAGGSGGSTATDGGSGGGTTTGDGGSTATGNGGTTGSGGSTTSGGGGTTTTTGTGSPGTDYAPYFYTWGWGNPAYPFTSLVDLRQKTQIEGVTLAFVLSDGGCSVTTDVQDHADDVQAFLAMGGKLKASFGGAAGTYIENACGDAGSLADAIQSFVDQTGILDLDFDVEQWQATTPEINQMRAQALKQVQDAKGIQVAFTLAAMPHDDANDVMGGVPSDSLAVVKAALDAGVQVSHMNLMVMDFYGNYGQKTMADLSISALTDAKAQLQGLVPGLSDEGAWGMLGATPMIGQNDDPNEVFTLDDAAALSAFAKQNHLGLVAFWAINRDQPGSGNLGLYSQAQDKAFAFHDALKIVAQ
ncbi:MAG: glycosyl hydrolase family 18 protein [Polyangiaceae bacterium]